MTDSQITAAYDARAAEYIALAGELEQMEAPDIELIGRWRDGTSGPLLDAGCGPGLWTAFLHDGGREVRGIDLSEEFIAAARLRHPGIEFQVGSFRELPFADASFGGLLAWYSLIHTPPEDLTGILAEFARVLAPGGSILIGFFDGEPRLPFAHAVAPAYYWDAASLTALLDAAGLTVTASDRRDRAPGAISTRPHGSVTAIRR
ncbi:class I SAM-dependent methyltransferase [Microbacterium bovistercoris]|uniref:Class I SAM-dependent methyltransferase n=1 Tax=Microbacterium bovistercoris TaxID=2293570 RepID=A0A371NR87_9MICO|nr:class I SAM-dependent methyltransferase [Microbacterium bovistercoris]REJ04267.1 class I SAM-dependent methyltransferase [Microbacterium bovistercoris]